jgi:hypothetical protein
MATVIQLRCDMTADCRQPVTYIDDNGYIYCTEHGQERQSWRRCRKLRPFELTRLKRGEQVTKY